MPGATASRAVDEAAAGLAPITLAEVVETANLQTRVDRKYLVPAPVFTRVVDRLAGRLAALDIDGLRLFRYESVYFDTGDLTSYRQHATGRRVRFKVRTRTYLDSGQCVFEVKSRGGRGETIKDRLDYDPEDRAGITDDARAFALRRIDAGLVDALSPALTTTYGRATLVDVAGGSRVTCDVGLAFADCAGPGRRRGPADLVLLESKTAGALCELDVLLWGLGHRPVSVSKYCIGLALLRPGLPANRWNRELRGHFGWTRADLTAC